MNKSNSATFATAEMTACPLAFPIQSSKLVYGYVQPYQFYRAGKRVLVYRLPGEAKPLAVSKPLVLLMAILLAAFATGYINGGHVPKPSGGGTLPTAVVPNITFHRLITISAVRGAINLPINTVPGKLVQTELPYRADLLPRKYLPVREIT